MESNNRIGLSKNDYVGKPSTLCKGCGHDSITNAITQAYFELGVPPYEVAKFSGIGCSSKTPAYFIDRAHGFNGVHGRMPSVATGAKLANRRLTIIGVSGDGDTASIGLGHFCHSARRNVDMTYIIENNGTYGLTKGQFSATSDTGSKNKRGVPNIWPVIDCCVLAIELGASFVARSFSGDRKQVISLLKAAYSHKGFALLDIISPCVTFNNHDGSTKSYTFCKEHDVPLQELGYVPAAENIHVEMKEGEVRDIELHDGSHLTLKKLDREYDPSSKMGAFHAIEEARKSHTLLTGLLYINPLQKDLDSILNLTDTPLISLGENELVPGAEVLKKINQSLK
ncbi:MAG: 2-oxoacid:ferredoxin oxidoreductase subunit beta [Deltaproteobacteria bacterium]|nr:2-oxoacid:ferredoxin oxidoreductase subunit beta [Deltaproteobacteria bacterium]